MNNLETVRTIILTIGWPILVAGSVYVYLFIKGNPVYRMIKGSLVGKITRTLLITMLVGMYSLGIVTTAYMFENVTQGVAVGLPVFAIWFLVFVWAMKTLAAAANEVSKLGQD
ncbi:MAG: hypothetical protein ACYC1Y_00080 [Minisyncoccota bacterium]